MKLDVRSVTELQQQAQAGDVQAIAYWLNLYLLSQEQCARVSSLSPGYLDIQVRCRAIPDGDRLLRSIHERLHRLALPDLRGAKIQISLDRPYLRVLEDRFLIFQPAAEPIQRVPQTLSKNQVWKGLRSLMPVQQLRTLGAALRDQSKDWKATIQSYLNQITSSNQIASVTVPTSGSYRMLTQPAGLLHPPLLVGAAIATFVAGCSYEAFTYYGTSPLQASSRALPSVPVPFVSRGDRPLPQTVDTVQMGDKQIPVYAVPSVTASEGVVTLLFRPASEFPITEQPDVVLSTLGDPDQLSGFLSSVPSAPADAVSDAQSGLTIVHLSGQYVEQAGGGNATRTRNALEWQGIPTTKPSRHPSAFSPPLVVDVKGQRIAYLSYAFADTQDSTIQAITSRSTADITDLREQVDWVVVNYDTSENLASYPSDWQVDVAHSAVDQGADVVVGYNASAVQGAERYESSAIAYALGHLDLSQSGNDTSQSTVPVALRVQLRRDRPVQAELIPLMLSHDEGEIHRAMLYLQQASGLFDDPIPAPANQPESAMDRARERDDLNQEGRPPRTLQQKPVRLNGFTTAPNEE